MISLKDKIIIMVVDKWIHDDNESDRKTHQLDQSLVNFKNELIDQYKQAVKDGHLPPMQDFGIDSRRPVG